MKEIGNIKILFVAGFGPIVDKGKASEKLYMETFDIPFKQEVRTFGIPSKQEEGGYLYTEEMEGVKHFALWPLSLVAQACFDKDSWPRDIPVPQAWIDFEVDDLEKATAELESRGRGIRLDLCTRDGLAATSQMELSGLRPNERRIRTLYSDFSFR